MIEAIETRVSSCQRVTAVAVTTLFVLGLMAGDRTGAAGSLLSTSQAEAKKTGTPGEVAAGYFPNNVLINQNNQPVHFFDDLLRGKTVLINLMFTTCAGICPAMTANLQKVQGLLGDRVGKDMNMISLTVDPVTDTPEALKSYTAKFNVKPGWHFLTGSKADVDVVLRKLRGYVDDKNQHNSILMIGNVETGEWMKMLAMSKPSEIVEKALKIAGSKKD
jgi:protein SCO1